jgi:inosose dehydratase
MSELVRVANAPCSWGVLEFDLRGESAPAVRVLDEMARAGYAGTELGDWGFMPTEPAALAAELRPRGLEMAGAFVPVRFRDPAAAVEGAPRAVKVARLLAAVNPRALVVLADDNCTDPVRTACAGRIRPDQGLSPAEWRHFAAGVEAVARAVTEATGLGCVFHHHGGGFVETPAEVDRLLELTDPAVVSLCLDTGHYAFGGGDPLAALERHDDRIRHVHFKDCEPAVRARSQREEWDYHRAVRHGVFSELGRGCVPFPRIVEALRARGWTGWAVVEQDVLPGLGTPFESAVRNREYLRQLGL